MVATPVGPWAQGLAGQDLFASEVAAVGQHIERYAHRVLGLTGHRG